MVGPAAAGHAVAEREDRAHPSLGLHAELQSELALLEDLHPVADPVVLAEQAATAALINVPRAWAKPRPTAWIASEALVSTPRVALANDSTGLACRSPSYKVVMKFRRSCLRSHCPDEAGRF